MRPSKETILKALKPKTTMQPRKEPQTKTTRVKCALGAHKFDPKGHYCVKCLSINNSLSGDDFLGMINRNDQLPKEVVEYLVHENLIGPKSSCKSWGNIGVHPNTSSELLEYIYTNYQELPREMFVNPKLPQWILNELVTFKDWEYDKRARISAIAIRNPAVESPQISNLYFKSSSLTTLQLAAILQSEETPPEVLKHITQNTKKQTILIAIAKHMHTPIEILESLADDTRLTVRKALLKNPKINATIIEKLSNDRSSSVRIGVQWYLKWLSYLGKY